MYPKFYFWFSHLLISLVFRKDIISLYICLKICICVTHFLARFCLHIRKGWFLVWKGSEFHHLMAFSYVDMGIQPKEKADSACQNKIIKWNYELEIARKLFQNWSPKSGPQQTLRHGKLWPQLNCRRVVRGKKKKQKKEPTWHSAYAKFLLFLCRVSRAHHGQQQRVRLLTFFFF